MIGDIILSGKEWLQYQLFLRLLPKEQQASFPVAFPKILLSKLYFFPSALELWPKWLYLIDQYFHFNSNAAITEEKICIIIHQPLNPSLLCMCYSNQSDSVLLYVGHRLRAIH